MTWQPELGRCWPYPSPSKALGYGMFRLNGRKGPMVYAHRVAYEELVGPIPEGHQIDHLCRNRACYNPAHLDAVPQAENLRRQIATMGRDERGRFRGLGA